MKIKADAKRLRDTLSELTPFARVVKYEGSKDVVRTCRLEAEGTILTAYTGDMRANQYGERQLTAQVVTAGAANVELTQVLDVLGVFDGEVEIDIVDGESGTLNTRRSTLPVRGSIDRMMRLPSPTQGWTDVDKAENLILAAALADRCRRQDDDLQYDINGLCLLPTAAGLDLVGTDGNHLIAITTGATNPCNEIVVCQPLLAKALTLFDKRQPIKMCVTQDCLWLKQDGRLNVVGRLTGGAYPDYRQIIDQQAVVAGTLTGEDANRLVTVIRKRILEATPQGLVRLAGADNELRVWGRHRNFTFTAPMQGIRLPAVACSADGLAKIISLFEGGAAISYSAGEQHLYLSAGRKFAVIGLEPDYLT